MGPHGSGTDVSTTLDVDVEHLYETSVTTPLPLTKAEVPGASSSVVNPHVDKAAKSPTPHAFSSILLGQVLSVLIAMMSMSAASLDDRGVSVPSFVNFLNYGITACVFFLLPLALGRRPQRLSLPWWRYALYALVDVEANTLTVLAYRYTNITSVAMLDAFSIPAVMVLSRTFMRAKYTRNHLVGVALCLGGLGLTVMSDLAGQERTDDYPHALKGDVLCILGAAAYAGSNVMQENFVKNHDRVEFLGMLGVFGVLISGAQTYVLERDLLYDVDWTLPVVLFTVGYALSLSVMYSWTSLFLVVGDAALFNLSLLTSDVYALLFAFLVEHITPNSLYFVAFAVIFCGLVFYHSQPPPTHAECVGVNINGVHDKAFPACGEEGRLEEGCGQRWPNTDEESRRKFFFELRETSGLTASTYCGSLGDALSDYSEMGSPPPSPQTKVSLL